MADKPVTIRRADVAGWSLALDKLLDIYMGRKSPQALLLSGPEGILKEELALFLARSHLCEGSQHRPCDSCGVCRRMLSGGHANLLRLSLAAREKSIKIDQLRALLQQLALHPVEEGQRFVIIRDVDLMTIQAQNALLKSLEEPGEGTFFILTTANELAVLPTVLSRCQIQRLFPWADDRCQTFFERQGYGHEEAKALAARCNGRPGQALLMMSNDKYQALSQLMADSFLAVERLGDIPRAAMLLKDSREDAGLMLDLLEQQAQAALAHKLGGSTGGQGWDRARLPGLRRVMEEIYKARRYLASNVSWQAVADRLLLVIAKEIYSCQWS